MSIVKNLLIIMLFGIILVVAYSSLSGYSESRITGKAVDEGEQKEVLEITLQELSEAPWDYRDMCVSFSGEVGKIEEDFISVSDGKGNEFMIRNSGQALEIGSEYDFQGVVKRVSGFYYRYYQLEYYLDPEEECG